MQIHVVQQGQSLYEISQTYSLTVQEIATANQIDPAHTLVIGQTLVIPIVGKYYFVVSGDTLTSIASKFGFSTDTLIRVNSLNSSIPLPVGLRLYIPPMPRHHAEVNAYIEPRGNSVSAGLTQAAREASPHLTYLAPFSFRINRDGTLTPPPLGNLRTIAQQSGTTLMMVVTNLEASQFSAELGEIILNDEKEVQPMSPDAFRDFIQAQTAVFAKVVADGHITAEN